MTKNERVIEVPVLPAIWGRWRGLSLAVPLLVCLSGCVTTGGPSGMLDDGVAVTAAATREERERRGDTGPGVTATALQELQAQQGSGDSYAVRGKRYYVKDSIDGHVEKGLASWYGKRFHGRRTSSGERYDMFALTAAHKTLPLPTYAEVTNLKNGRQVLVKINDRGPFAGDRVIDLSYAAAQELKMVEAGVAMVEVRAIDPFEVQARENLFLAASKGPARLSPASADLGGGRRPANRADGDDSLLAAASGLAGDRGRADVAPTQLAAADSPPEGLALASARTALPSSSTSSTLDPADGQLYVQAGTFGDRANAEALRRRLVSHLAEQVQVRTSDDLTLPRFEVKVGPLAGPTQAEGVSQQLAALGVRTPQTVVE